MKKLSLITLISAAMMIGNGCAKIQTTSPAPSPIQTSTAQKTQPQATFKEPGIESEFTLPAGWTYSKVINHVSPDAMLPNGAGYDPKNLKDLSQFSFFDQDHKSVGGASFFSAKNQDMETSFDDCWRAWEISLDQTGNRNNGFLDHYLRVTGDGGTSVAAEICGEGGGGMTYIYWIPGINTVMRQQDFQSFHGKKPLRVVAFHDIDVSEEKELVQLVHDFAKSVTIKN